MCNAVSTSNEEKYRSVDKGNSVKQQHITAFHIEM